GGVHYAEATETLRAFAEAHDIPVVETQAGKSALPWDHPLNFGPIGVTGGSAANAICESADVILAVGTRLQDFTTGSWSLFRNPGRRMFCLNVNAYDAAKHGAEPVQGDAKLGLEELHARLGEARAPRPDQALRAQWFAAVDPLTAPPAADDNALPTDMQVIGAVQRQARPETVVMGAAGTMPGELHKLWKAGRPGSYHMEYGYSCMGYEIAGALGIKMADPAADVIAMVGDGSYLMANSELATAAMMGIPFTVVVTDNRGFGCINRLQKGTGNAPFNNLLDDAVHVNESHIDFAAHAASLGAVAEHVGSIAELEAALKRRGEVTDRPYVVVIDTDPDPSTPHGGWWWEVAVPEVSTREAVREARARYEQALKERA
ncbi:MAG: 3D-(3,5/4)-trihydroxycyclohexane-1,2-dione acylhydrolase (decyclizing), partial [Alphaproteobacteria bacterium]